MKVNSGGGIYPGCREPEDLRRQVIEGRVLSEMAEQVCIVPGDLGEDAGAVGAAALVLRELFALSVPHEGGQIAEPDRSAS